jgi:acetylornithine deacetylase
VSEVSDLLSSLVRTPSVSGEEAAVRDGAVAWLSAHGVPANASGRNAVAVVEGRTGSDPRRGLLLLSHTDTVPVGPGWTREPFDGRVEDGRLHGRGSNDAKASVAAMMVAAAAVARAGLVGRLVCAFVCDEETGGEGIEALAGVLPPYSAAVVGEPTNLDVCPGQRGLLRATVVAHGRSCHASRPWEGENAIDAAARDVLAIHGIALPDEDPFLGRATIAATVIHGGTRPNVIPGRCEVEVDGRPTPRYDNETMLRLLREAVRGEVIVRSRRFEPVATDAAAEVVRVAREASPGGRVRGFGGVSDLFHVRHVPGVVLGPGTSEQSHAPDESVEVAQVERAAAVYERLVRGYLA